jgi:hypothetical protein
VGLLAKGGVMLNRATLDSSFSGAALDGDGNRSSGTTHTTDDTLTFLSEVSLRGKWHLRPNFSFRAGVELMFIDSIALAPYQINFVPGGYSPLISSNQSTYLGGSVGFEGYW